MRLFAVLALAASPLAAQSFEGVVSMNVTAENGRTMPLNYQIKGEKVRVEMTMGGNTVATVMDASTKKMLMIMTAQKMYMERDLTAPAPSSPRGGRGQVTVERTGRTEIIAGHTCEHVNVTGEDGTVTDVCLAKDINASFRMPSAGGPMAPSRPDPAWMSAASGFPLKVSQGNKVSIEVTKIEKQSLDASLFEAPAGFQKLDMGGMFKRP